MFVFNVPPTAKIIWRRGHELKSHPTDWWSRESNLRPLVYKASGLSTTPQRLLGITSIEAGVTPLFYLVPLKNCFFAVILTFEIVMRKSALKIGMISQKSEQLASLIEDQALNTMYSPFSSYRFSVLQFFQNAFLRPHYHSNLPVLGSYQSYLPYWRVKMMESNLRKC